MLIIPAIDIIEGKCVRLTQGRFDTKKIYNEDPIQVAKKFEKDGADIIHIVDLEGAKAQQPKNMELIIQIKKEVQIPIEIGGGIRDLNIAEEYLEAGIDRIILGSKAIQDTIFIKELIRKFGPEKIVIGIDAMDGKVATEAWQETSEVNYLDFAKKLKEIGVTEIIFTDIARDGMLGEPNYEPLIKLNKLGMNIIASGGISDMNAVEKLRDMNVYGAIIGKAIYEGKIDLGCIKQPRRLTIDCSPSKARLANRAFGSCLTKRVIPCMDIAKGRVVKGINFKNLKDAGDPVKLGRYYSDEGADELVFLDIMATVENRSTFYKLVKRIAKEINIPFTVGGGIRTLDDIQILLQNGADKVSIGSLAVTDPEFIRMASERFGNQCIVISVDPKWNDNKWEIYIKGGRENTKMDAIKFVKQMEEYGAGELLVNSLDRDGTEEGYDIRLLKAITDSVNIPVIASSGAGKKEDFLEAFEKGNCDAALAASLFHYNKLTIREVKNYLISNNVSIRP